MTLSFLSSTSFSCHWVSMVTIRKQVLTCTSIFGYYGEFCRFVDDSVTEAWTVSSHMTTVDGINMEFEWTT